MMIIHQTEKIGMPLWIRCTARIWESAPACRQADGPDYPIGGPSKTTEQINGVPNADIAADGIKGGTVKKYHFGCLAFCIDPGNFLKFIRKSKPII